MGEDLGEMEVVAYRLLEGAEAEVTERKPKRKSAEGAGELDGFFEEGEPFDGVCGEGAGVVAGVREGAARVGGIAIEKASAAGGLIEPFVRIERDGVGEIDSVECFGNGERCECAIGSVDVEPEAVLATDGGDFAERVDAAGCRGAGAGNYGDGLEAGAEVVLDCLAQDVDAHAEGVINGDQADGIVAQAEKRSGLGVGHVGFG